MPPSVMLSGPDLGGGLLHQLTSDPSPDGLTFTFHAQDGGADAGGPPIGSPEPGGYQHPVDACPFGGPRCWHRTFQIAEMETHRVRAAYNRMRFVMGAQLAQWYRDAPVPLTEPIEELANRAQAVLTEKGIPWQFGGAAAAWLRGGVVPPRDLEVETTAEGVSRLSEAVGEYLIEPPGWTRWGTSRTFGARAFVGTLQAGTRVEWGVAAETPGVTHLRNADVPRPGVSTRAFSTGGRTVPVGRPEVALLRATLQGRPATARGIAEALRSIGADLQLLERLLEESELPPEKRGHLMAQMRATLG